MQQVIIHRINPLNAELNPSCHLLTFLGAHYILHVSRIRVEIRMWQQSDHNCPILAKVKNSVGIFIRLLHWQPFKNSHFHFVILKSGQHQIDVSAAQTNDLLHGRLQLKCDGTR